MLLLLSFLLNSVHLVHITGEGSQPLLYRHQTVRGSPSQCHCPPVLTNMLLEVICGKVKFSGEETTSSSTRGLANLWHMCQQWHTKICWLHRDCIWITVGTIQYDKWNISTRIWSDVRCLPDIYHWGASLAVNGQIHDIGQNILQSSCKAGISSSFSHFQSFFLITFLKEAFIRNWVIILWINYTIMI
jgi:hypothetical protein